MTVDEELDLLKERVRLKKKLNYLLDHDPYTKIKRKTGLEKTSKPYHSYYPRTFNFKCLGLYNNKCKKRCIKLNECKKISKVIDKIRGDYEKQNG